MRRGMSDNARSRSSMVMPFPKRGRSPPSSPRATNARVEHGLARSLPIQITIIQQLHCGNTLCHYWQKIMFGVWLGSGFGGFFRIQRIPKGVVGPDVRTQRLDAAVL